MQTHKNLHLQTHISALSLPAARKSLTSNSTKSRSTKGHLEPQSRRERTIAGWIEEEEEEEEEETAAEMESSVQLSDYG
jgi:hypothetical protein